MTEWIKVRYCSWPIGLYMYSGGTTSTSTALSSLAGASVGGQQVEQVIDANDAVVVRVQATLHGDIRRRIRADAEPADLVTRASVVCAALGPVPAAQRPQTRPSGLYVLAGHGVQMSE